MKRLIGYLIMAAVGYYIWKNHFRRLFQPKDQVQESLEEVRLKNEIGDNKRAVFLANQVPVSTIGDTPFAGVPLTALSSPQLMQPKGLQLLPKGGATTPNPFDRVLNWVHSLAAAAVLLAIVTLPAAAAVPMFPPGRQIWVQPGQNLYAVKQGASAGTTIVVGPGMFTAGVTNLLKNGVNWFFYPGATISNRLGSPIFQDYEAQYSGGVTSVVAGYGEFIDQSSMAASTGLGVGGLVTLTRTTTKLSIQAHLFKSTDGDGDAAFLIVTNAPNFVFDVDEFDYKLGGVAIFWCGGNAIGRVRTIRSAGDSPLWVDAASLTVTPGDWDLTVDLIDSRENGSGNASAAVYFKPGNSVPNQRLWLKCHEIRGGSVAVGYGGCITVDGGKLYVNYQKMSAVEEVANPRPLVQIDNGECWLRGMKTTVTNNQHFLWQNGGHLYWNNDHFEDAGSGANLRPYNFLIAGGTNYITAQRALTSWGPMFKLTGGLTHINGGLWDTWTLRAPSSFNATNAIFWGTGTTVTNLVLMGGTVLLPDCIFSITNANAWTIKAYGTAVNTVKSNVTVTTTVQGGTLLVDGNADR